MVTTLAQLISVSLPVLCSPAMEDDAEWLAAFCEAQPADDEQAAAFDYYAYVCAMLACQ